MCVCEHMICVLPPGQVHQMREGGAGSSRALRIALERHTDLGPRNHMAELGMYYVAGGEIDQFLREDTSDMI